MSLIAGPDSVAGPPTADLILTGKGPKIRIQVRAPSERAVTGVLQAVSTEVAHVSFQNPAPAFAVGSRVETFFMVGPTSVSFSAVVSSRVENADQRDYVVRFVGDPSDLERLAETIHRVMNRRRSVRVAPGAKRCSIVVRARADDPWTAGELDDISTMGIGLVCRPEVEPPGLAESVTLEMKLEIPGHQGALLIVGFVLSRALVRQAVRYGVVFDDSKSPAFRTTQDKIAEFIALRQREMLAEKARAPIR